MQIIGQKSNLEIIDTWSELPQFIIIQGPRSYGKTALALHLCEKFGVHYVLMKNSVETIREMISNIGIGANTMFHFKDFDKASIQAKNALLKITEEPFINNYICITGSKQLSTLESRARKIVMNPYTLDDVVQFSKNFMSEDLVTKLYYAGLNTPSKLFACKTYENIENLYKCALETFEKLTYLNYEDAVRISQMFENNVRDDGIDAVNIYITLLVGLIETNIMTIGNYSYDTALNILLSAKQELSYRNITNKKMFLYRALYLIAKDNCNVNYISMR